MITFLKIYGTPTRQFYMNADALPYLSSIESKHALLIDPGALQAGTQGENTNVTVRLKNNARQCTQLFTVPPMGAKAILYSVVKNQAVSQFSGVIQSVNLDKSVCAIRIEA